MPEARSEAPDPAEQHSDDEHREQEPAGEARHVGRRLAQPQGLDLLDLGRAHPLAVADDDLALEDRDADRRDGLGGSIASLGGELLAERGVGDEERADQLGREHPFRLVQPTGHPPRQAAPSIGHFAVTQLGALSGVEDAGRLGPDDGPASGIEPDQRLPGSAR